MAAMRSSSEGAERGSIQDGKLKIQIRDRALHSRVADAGEADGESPHPPFGHLLPGGEKGTALATAERASLDRTVGRTPMHRPLNEPGSSRGVRRPRARPYPRPALAAPRGSCWRSRLGSSRRCWRPRRPSSSPSGRGGRPHAGWCRRRRGRHTAGPAERPKAARTSGFSLFRSDAGGTRSAGSGRLVVGEGLRRAGAGRLRRDRRRGPAAGPRPRPRPSRSWAA